MSNNNFRIVGFRAFHRDSEQYLHFNESSGWNFLSLEVPRPISRADCHRRIAAFIEQPGEEFNDLFTIDVVYTQW